MWKKVLFVTTLAFTIAIIFSLLSKEMISKVNVLFVLILFLALIVFIGVAFDILGTAATAAKIEPMKSMAAQRITGAKESISIIKNADRFSNICNDVVGDVCGTVGGALASGIIVIFATNKSVESVANILVIAFISGVTVGGKSIGKTFAIGHPEKVILFCGKIIYRVRKVKEKILGKRDNKKNVNKH